MSTKFVLRALAMVGALFLVTSRSQAREEPTPKEAVIEAYYAWSFDELDTLTSRLCLASSANGWDPASVVGVGTLLCENRMDGKPTALQAEFRLPWAVVSDPNFEFKITRGSWDTVEVDEHGADIPNRKIDPAAWTPMSDGTMRVHIKPAGWADQRGTRWAEAKKESTVVGNLSITELSSEILNNSRKIRVWLPPGYWDTSKPARAYPVLFMHDGQNLFDDATAFAGEWKVDETATALIEAGAVEPFIVVGIDNIGSGRANEYLPMPAGQRLPGQGGGADRYLAMIREELIPMLRRNYKIHNSRFYMGGSSFGGVVTLHAAMSQPGWLSGIIAESPSFWVGDGAFLERCSEAHRWPNRVFMAMGDQEYGRTGDDQTLVDDMTVVAAAMRSSGLEEPRLRVVVGEGDKHNEQAWAKRLPDALRQLFGKAE